MSSREETEKYFVLYIVQVDLHKKPARLTCFLVQVFLVQFLERVIGISL